MATHYRRNLPHIHPPGTALFLTMRLAGSLPQALVQDLVLTAADLPEQRQRFAQFEQQLDTGGYGPTWLAQAAVVQLVLGGLHQQATNGHYEPLAACAMPNHLHLVLRLPATYQEPFYKVLQRYKSATALLANRLLLRTGAFWQSETFDHAVRESNPTALMRAIHYTVHNPVKAGLCQQWREWAGTYLAPDWEEFM